MKKTLMTIITLLLLSSFAFAQTIVANGSRVTDNEMQVVFFTITENAVDYRMAANTPILSGQDLQDYLDSKILRYWYSILHTSYPGARFSSFVGDNKLEQLQAWIDAGHTNLAYCSNDQSNTPQDCEDDGGMWIPEEVIIKVQWVDTWEISVIQAEQDMKNSIFYKKTDQQINDYINTNWTNITDSKATFKKLVKEVRDIVRRQHWEDY